MQNKNILIGLLIVVVIVGAGLMLRTKDTSLAPDAAVETESGAGEQGMEGKTVVEIKDFSFQPKTLTVKAGTTVTFLNKDITGHSATADDKRFDTGILRQGESATVTFDTVGTYAYHCTPHPNMQATITVE